MGVKIIFQPTDKSKYYPRRSRIKGEEGVIVLRIEILADGSIGKIEVIDAVSKRLADAAIRFVRDCRYAPATVNGRPVRGYIVRPIPFELE